MMESQDYEYPVEAWLQDMEMELGNAGEYENVWSFVTKCWKCLTGRMLPRMVFAVQ